MMKKIPMSAGTANLVKKAMMSKKAWCEIC
jgi:hypothetical protein